MFVALDIQHAMHMCHIVNCCLFGSIIFFPHSLLNCNIFLKNVYWYSRKSTRYSCPILMKMDFSEEILKKYSNMKCRENTSSGSRVVPCGQKERHGEAKSLFAVLRTSLINDIHVISTPVTINPLKQKTHQSKVPCT
jgi:hypothetical protein